MKNLSVLLRAGNWLLLSLLIFGSCTSPSEKEKTAPATETKENKPEIYTVEISQMKFNPAELKVKKGDNIVFVNRDIVAHDVTEEKSKAWTSSPLQTGQYWTLVATESTNYYCSLHPTMKGKIIVE